MEDIRRLEEELKKKKEQAIQNLLKQREEIDKQLAELGYKTSNRGRPPGKAKKKASSK